MENYVNKSKTKVIVFRYGGPLRKNTEVLELVNKFTYFGIYFKVGGSYNKTFVTLTGNTN